MNRAKPEDVKIQPVRFRITRILTNYAQKLLGTATQNSTTLIHGFFFFFFKFIFTMDG